MSAKTLKNWRDHQLTVAIRVRPFTQDELELAPSKVAHVVQDNMVVLLDPADDPDDILRANRSREKQYIFDFAFDGKATQEDVYEKTTKFLINGVLDGFNATVFAYGATGAGKTYTMLGQDENPGIMARTLNDLFHAMEATKEDLIYKVTMSYLEIYNEMIRDLLNPTSGFLDLREDAAGNVQVAGISEVSTKSTREVMRLLQRGNKERTSEPTAANKTSSRSHAILQVTVKTRSRVRSTSQEIKVGKLFMIDLAGSERASQTKNRGKRMIEGAHINRSLLALGNCINALAERGGYSKYVNFRDSKLTRLLKDSLGGNCRTVMIAHVSPASLYFEESRNTLLYADRAKNIKTRVKANYLNVSYHIAQYTSIITELRKEISRLKQKISEQEIEPRPTQGSASIKDIQSEVERTTGLQDKKEMDRLRQQLVSNFKDQMEIRHSLMELENTNMEIAMDTNKHMLSISEWEQEKLRRQQSRRKDEKEGDDVVDNRDKEQELEKEAEEKSQSSYSPEPLEVSIAREEINALVQEQKKTAALKVELEKKLEGIKANGAKIEEVLPRKISSEEQRDILRLLCRVHELEVENTEMQTSALIHENMLRQKDLVIARFANYQGLCDEIIQQQRTLLVDNDVSCSDELEELYEHYQQFLGENNIARFTAMTLDPNKPFSMQALNSQHQGDTDGSEFDDKDNPPTNTKLLPKRSKDNVSGKEESQTRLFKQSPRSRQLKEHEKEKSVETPPKRNKTFPSDTFLTQLNSNNDASSPTELQASQVMDGGTPLPTSRKEKKEMSIKTKNIAAIAAKRKTHQTLYSKPKFDRLNLQDKSVVSLNSVHEVSESESEYLSQSRLAKHDKLLGDLTPPPGLRQTVSEDDFSMDTAGKRVGFNDSLSVHSKTRYKGVGKKTTGKQSYEKRRRGKFESVEQSNYKQKAPHSKRTEGRRNVIPESQLRNPPSFYSGDNDLLSFEIAESPPIVVYQSGIEKKKAHTIQKKYRGPVGPLASDSSTSSTPPTTQRTNKKQKATIPSNAQKSTLSISGFTVPRNERIVRRV
ncbi:kinesin-like protein KIF19 [Glandiceps talaboti]